MRPGSGIATSGTRSSNREGWEAILSRSGPSERISYFFGLETGSPLLRTDVPTADRSSRRDACSFPEHRQGRDAQYAGTWAHLLTMVDDSWRIRRKKVSLINCDQSLWQLPLL